MKNAPNSKSNLDRALQRFAGDPVRANGLRGQMANAIVAKAFWHRKLSLYGDLRRLCVKKQSARYWHSLRTRHLAQRRVARNTRPSCDQRCP